MLRILHPVYGSHTTLDNNNWIFSISTSSPSVMGSSNHKIIIWGPLSVYNQRCKSPSHLFAFRFWLRPQCLSANLNINWDSFLWQRALFNKDHSTSVLLHWKCQRRAYHILLAHGCVSSGGALSQLSRFYTPALDFRLRPQHICLSSWHSASRLWSDLCSKRGF